MRRGTYRFTITKGDLVGELIWVFLCLGAVAGPIVMAIYGDISALLAEIVLFPVAFGCIASFIEDLKRYKKQKRK